MTAVGNNSLGTRSQLQVGSKSYAYYSLEKAAAALGDVSRLPFSMKVLLENLLRFEDGKTVTRAASTGPLLHHKPLHPPRLADIARHHRQPPVRA
jgi:aconitase A